MIEPSFFILFILTAVAEYALLISWNTAYFQLGIPIFSSQVELPRSAPTPISADMLEAWQHQSLFQPLVFRSLDDGVFGFREVLWNGLFHRAYTPVMHGQLTFNRETGKIVVLGLANWSVLVFGALWLSTMSHLGLFWLQLLLPVVFVGIYVLQFRRFRQVAIDAAELMKRPASGPHTPRTVGLR